MSAPNARACSSRSGSTSIAISRPAPSISAFARCIRPSGPTPSTSTVSPKLRALSRPLVTAITSVSAAICDGSSSGTRKRRVPGSRYMRSDQPPKRWGGSAQLSEFP